MKKIRPLDNQPRSATSRIPHEDSAGLLCDPKEKLTGTMRRVLMRSRQIVVDFPRRDPKPEAIRITNKLATLPLEKLHRRLHQSARRASTAKHLLAKMDPASKFRAGVAAEQDYHLAYFQFVRAEITSRGFIGDRPRVEQPHSDNNITGATS